MVASKALKHWSLSYLYIAGLSVQFSAQCQIYIKTTNTWSTLPWYRCYYLHRSRDALFPICGILSFQFYLRFLIKVTKVTTEYQKWPKKVSDSVLYLLVWLMVSFLPNSKTIAIENSFLVLWKLIILRAANFIVVMATVLGKLLSPDM